MEFLRTPDERFDNLPDFDFAPNYLALGDSSGCGLRMHVLDERQPDAAPVLLMHGEPTWCCLYRHTIAIFA